LILWILENKSGYNTVIVDVVATKASPSQKWIRQSDSSVDLKYLLPLFVCDYTMYCCVGLLIAGGIVCLILFFTTDVFEDEKEAEARAVNITGAGFPTVAPVTSLSPQATVFTPQPITPESTPSPTNAPTVTKQWQQVAGPFTAGNPSTKYGHAVALANDFLAIGEPLADFDDRGNVAIFQRSGNWRNAGLGFSLDTLQVRDFKD